MLKKNTTLAIIPRKQKNPVKKFQMLPLVRIEPGTTDYATDGIFKLLFMCHLMFRQRLSSYNQ